jgi:hypothetical protein
VRRPAGTGRNLMAYQGPSAPDTVTAPTRPGASNHYRSSTGFLAVLTRKGLAPIKGWGIRRACDGSVDAGRPSK